nr:hypothetical protein [Tanacetum cinerariifolium]
PEWSQHVTVVHQTKDLHTADYTQLYDFLKYNQKEMVGGNSGNQFRQYVVQNAGNPDGWAKWKPDKVLQLQRKEYDLMAAAADLDEIEEVNANCILMANLQQASTSGTQTDSAPVYDTDVSAEVQENCDNNEIFNMFT